MQWLMPFYWVFDWRYRKWTAKWRKIFSIKPIPKIIEPFWRRLYCAHVSKAQAEVFTNFRLQFERMDIPVSKRLRMG
jgi:hypothetical protein